VPATIGAIATYVGGAVAGVAGVGSTVGLVAGLTAYAGTYVALTVGLAYATNELLGPKNPETGASGREITVRSTIEPRKIVYGEALVSGPVAYVNTRAPANAPSVDTLAELWHVIALAGHECSDWLELRLDGEIIPRSDFDANGDVFQGRYMGVVPALSVYFNAGGDNQLAIPEMVAAFSDWTGNHRGRGMCHMATRFQTADVFAELWEQGPPQNIQLLLQGKKVYDPRRDPTSPHYDGAGAQVLGDRTTYEYSNNPVLCTADYMTDERVGMGFSLGRFDWGALAAQADVCDVIVNTPGGMQKRFTINGTLHTGTENRANLRELLTSFNGRITYTGDKFIILAPSFVAPTLSLTDDDILSDLQVSTGIRKQDRYNAVRGVFYDPDNEFKPNEYPDVSYPALLFRDNGERLYADQRFNMVNDVYQAQRVALQRLLLDDQSTSCVATFNMKALELIVHDRVFLSVGDLGWNNKIFQVKEWTFVDTNGTLGIQMRMIEDDGAAYADPDVGDYSEVDASGNVTDPINTVPAPESATAIAVSGGIRIEWENSAENQFYNRTRVYCSESPFVSEVRVFEGVATSHIQTYAAATTARYTVVHVNENGAESAPATTGVATSIVPSGGSANGVWGALAGEVWVTNDGINFGPAPFTFSETAEFFLNGTTSMPLTAVLDTSTGLITVTAGTITGPESANVTFNFNGTNGSDHVTVVIAHSSGPSVIASYSAINVNASGPAK